MQPVVSVEEGRSCKKKEADDKLVQIDAEVHAKWIHVRWTVKSLSAVTGTIHTASASLRDAHTTLSLNLLMTRLRYCARL